MITSIEKNIELYNKQNAIHIDYKLDYMARLFRKISHKRFECYVIQRIWHSLNDDRVKFVVQQYVRRNKEEDKYALADLYLPQLGIIVEVNEAYHLASERQKEIDAIRNAEVSKTADAIVRVVDCTKKLPDIHSQIAFIVNEIKQRIKKRESESNFKPWGGEDTLTVEYHKQKGCVRVEDDEYFRTIDDICETFGTKAKHRGFLRAGGADIPGHDDHMLWFPSVTNSGGWHNVLFDEKTIYEFNEKDDISKKHFEGIKSNHNLPKRVTFFREKDDLGFNFYRFVGVYELDYVKSIKQKKTVWKKCSDEFCI